MTNKLNELMFGIPKPIGFAITSVQNKAIRRVKINEFVSKYGRGDKSLIQAQKQARIAKFIGNIEIEKVYGFGNNKEIGVRLDNKTNLQRQVTEDHKGMHDTISKEIIDNLDIYPKDSRAEDDLRIVFIDVKDNGELEMQMIHKDGNEGDSIKRQLSGLFMFDDETSARNEILQYKAGKLGEVSDRTMILHDEAELLNIFLEDDSIDTNEDKESQY